MHEKSGLDTGARIAALCLLCFLLCIPTAPAQSSANSISFQGALTGAGGQPLANGNYNLTFKFYNVPTGGTALATSNVPNVPVTGGIVSTAIPVDGAWFNGQTRYLGIGINGATELTPRVLVTAVPYAIGASQLTGTEVSADAATGDIVIQHPAYQAGEAEYFRIRHRSRDGGWPDPLVPSHEDAAIVIGKVDGFDPNWTHGSYIGFKTTANNRDALPSESVRIEPHGIRLLYDGYQSGSVDYTSIRHVAKDGSWPGAPAHPDAEIVFGKVDGFDTDWTHGSYISFRTTANNRDHPPEEVMRVTSGAVRVSVLQITGGADLAEHLSVTDVNLSDEFNVEPGMVVSIDPSGNRQFKLADEPYDRKRVGIISGGHGVQPGLVLRDEGNPQADGEQPIALTGQVWCHADTAFGPITPGDLLTTSATPGHAMKVTDDTKARFAVLGQALTGLKEGRGWVQVLVGKQ